MNISLEFEIGGESEPVDIAIENDEEIQVGHLRSSNDMIMGTDCFELKSIVTNHPMLRQTVGGSNSQCFAESVNCGWITTSHCKAVQFNISIDIGSSVAWFSIDGIVINIILKSTQTWQVKPGQSFSSNRSVPSPQDIFKHFIKRDET